MRVQNTAGTTVTTFVFDAVGSAQYSFFLTFGAQAYSEATGNRAKPKEPKACVEAYDSDGNGTGKVCQ